jgi:hypothetical protein
MNTNEITTKRKNITEPSMAKSETTIHQQRKVCHLQSQTAPVAQPVSVNVPGTKNQIKSAAQDKIQQINKASKDECQRENRKSIN